MQLVVVVAAYFVLIRFRFSSILMHEGRRPPLVVMVALLNAKSADLRLSLIYLYTYIYIY